MTYDKNIKPSNSRELCKQNRGICDAGSQSNRSAIACAISSAIYRREDAAICLSRSLTSIARPPHGWRAGPNPKTRTNASMNRPRIRTRQLLDWRRSRQTGPPHGPTAASTKNFLNFIVLIGVPECCLDVDSRRWHLATLRVKGVTSGQTELVSVTSYRLQLVRVPERATLATYKSEAIHTRIACPCVAMNRYHNAAQARHIGHFSLRSCHWSHFNVDIQNDTKCKCIARPARAAFDVNRPPQYIHAFKNHISIRNPKLKNAAAALATALSARADSYR
ncbi:hypothetical protein EVAR_36452_1 [Eumeta japonica]|uniref:Uncharacterized protein n=1 Tax=Eumeta variegata TaxID=151549 RepID=A0A4C1VNM1_EUMVA|nr:hypothetical protein EVAR_36452_1 [Eumeta japonica]